MRKHLALVCRTSLIAALTSVAAACGGGGGSSPPPPPPSPNAAPSITSPAAVSVRENAVGVVYRQTATDPENQTITFGALAGPDAARFTVNQTTRELRFAVQPDFEAPADAGGNNVYDISFTASDGNSTVTQNVAITVTNTGPGFRVRRLASGMTEPVFVAGLPDGSGRVVVIERAGRIRVMNPTTGAFEANDFLDLRGAVTIGGEMGVLSIAFSPNFVVDRTFYLWVNPSVARYANLTEIRKYRTQANYAQADASTVDVILIPRDASGDSNRGGTLAFDKSGLLLISIGDGGLSSNLATLDDAHNGKILRIDPSTDAYPTDPDRDYAIPPANPIQVPGASDRKPEVYAKGLRNPFRMSVDPVTGDIFIGDIGAHSFQEINRISPTATTLINLGWNFCDGPTSLVFGFDCASLTLPVTAYDGTIGSRVTGGVVYRGPIESLQGQYIFGDFNSNALWSVPIANLVAGSMLPQASLTVQTAAFAPDAGAIDFIAGFGTDNDGNVYIADRGGEVFVLEPSP